MSNIPKDTLRLDISREAWSLHGRLNDVIELLNNIEVDSRYRDDASVFDAWDEAKELIHKIDDSIYRLKTAKKPKLRLPKY